MGDCSLYRSHGRPSSAMLDLIDKHVKATSPLLADFYANAAKTRKHLQDIGAWPDKTKRPKPPLGKRDRAKPKTIIAKEAYAWGVANDATTIEACRKFGIEPDVLHSWIQYRDLPRLRKAKG